MILTNKTMFLEDARYRSESDASKLVSHSSPEDADTVAISYRSGYCRTWGEDIGPYWGLETILLPNTSNSLEVNLSMLRNHFLVTAGDLRASRRHSFLDNILQQFPVSRSAILQIWKRSLLWGMSLYGTNGKFLTSTHWSVISVFSTFINGYIDSQPYCSPGDANSRYFVLWFCFAQDWRAWVNGKSAFHIDEYHPSYSDLQISRLSEWPWMWCVSRRSRHRGHTRVIRVFQQAAEQILHTKVDHSRISSDVPCELH